MSIESMMPSNHLLLCSPLLLLPLIFPSIRVFSNESTLGTWWPKYWSFSISSSSEYSGLISFRLIGLISLQSKGLSKLFFSTTIWKHQFFGIQPSLWSNSHMTTGKTLAFFLYIKGLHRPLLATHSSILGLPLWLSCWRIHPQCGRPGFDPWAGKIPWRRERTHSIALE